MLNPTELRLYKSESEVVRYAQGEGFLQMTGDRALVLVDEVFKVDDLNASDLRTASSAPRTSSPAPRRAPRSAATRSATSAATRPSSSSPAADDAPRTTGQPRRSTLLRMDERVLAERLITYDTSNVEGLRAAAGFIKGWLEAREIAVTDHQYGDLLRADRRGRARRPGRRSCSTATTTWCPARPEQFEPRIQGDRLRGAAPMT